MNSWIELSSSAFAHNVATIGQLIHPLSIAFVVKSNAYGHGMREMIALAQEHPIITIICVASIQEGLLARGYGWNKDILVMSYHEGDYAAAIKNQLILAIFTHEQIHALGHAAQACAQHVKVHIKVDTGMSRLGFFEHELPIVMQLSAQYSFMRVDGVFSHLADTNNPDEFATYAQIACFERIRKLLADYAIPNWHLLASGSVTLPKDNYCYARIGTSLYGTWKTDVQKKRYQQAYPACTLQPILSWYSRVQSVYEKNAQRFAIVPVGFEDGYMQASGQQYVFLAGQLCPVVEVHAQWLVVQSDITQIGDHVTIVGRDVDIYSYAQSTGLLINQLCTSIHAKIARRVV